MVLRDLFAVICQKSHFCAHGSSIHQTSKLNCSSTVKINSCMICLQRETSIWSTFVNGISLRFDHVCKWYIIKWHFRFANCVKEHWNTVVCPNWKRIQKVIGLGYRVSLRLEMRPVILTIFFLEMGTLCFITQMESIQLQLSG